MRILSLISLLCFSSMALADWQLDPAASSLHFLSTKKAQVTEVHQFKNLQGSIDQQGNVSVTLDLNSVETGIGLRNERMKQFLFNTDRFPKATIRAKVDASLLNLLPGQVQDTTIHGTLDLHGMQQTVSAQVSVVGLSDGRIQVTTDAPVMISSHDFGLTAGIAKLKSLAGLDSITFMVPVTFNFQFKPKS